MLERNWRGASGEIDLVVSDGALLVVVEVKARADDRFGSPALAVDAAKQRRLRRLAVEWLAEHPERRGSELRFDVVAVTGATVEVFASAF